MQPRILSESETDGGPPSCSGCKTNKSEVKIGRVQGKTLHTKLIFITKNNILGYLKAFFRKRQLKALGKISQVKNTDSDMKRACGQGGGTCMIYKIHKSVLKGLSLELKENTGVQVNDIPQTNVKREYRD